MERHLQKWLAFALVWHQYGDFSNGVKKSAKKGLPDISQISYMLKNSDVNVKNAEMYFNCINVCLPFPT